MESMQKVDTVQTHLHTFRDVRNIRVLAEVDTVSINAFIC